MYLGNIYSPNLEYRDKLAFHFKHGNFNLVFRYDDGIMNNYDGDIQICRNIINLLRSESISKYPDWIFSFNESIIGGDDYEGLICRKNQDKILFGMTGNSYGNSCFLEISIQELEIIDKIAEFYNKILDILIDKKTNSLGSNLKRWLF